MGKANCKGIFLKFYPTPDTRHPTPDFNNTSYLCARLLKYINER